MYIHMYTYQDVSVLNLAHMCCNFASRNASMNFVYTYMCCVVRVPLPLLTAESSAICGMFVRYLRYICVYLYTRIYAYVYTYIYINICT